MPEAQPGDAAVEALTQESAAPLAVVPLPTVPGIQVQEPLPLGWPHRAEWLAPPIAKPRTDAASSCQSQSFGQCSFQLTSQLSLSGDAEAVQLPQVKAEKAEVGCPPRMAPAGAEALCPSNALDLGPASAAVETSQHVLLGGCFPGPSSRASGLGAARQELLPVGRWPERTRHWTQEGLPGCRGPEQPGPGPGRPEGPGGQAEAPGPASSELEGQVTEAPFARRSRPARLPCQRGGGTSPEPQAAESSPRAAAARRMAVRARLPAAGGEAAPARATWQCEVGEVLALAAESRWHVVCAPGSPAVRGGAAQLLAPEPQAVPAGAAAVLLLAPVRGLALPALRQAAASLAAAASEARAPPPLIVLLLGEAPCPEDTAALSAAQRALRAAGAEDVLHKAGEMPDLRFAVAASVARAELQRQAQAELRELRAAAAALEEQVAALQQLLQEAQQRPEPPEPPEGMFWRTAHVVFEGFPAMSGDISRTVAADEEVGPLRLGAALGKGAFGRVFRATHSETGEDGALKVVSKADLCNLDDVRLLWTEVQTLHRMAHPNVIKAYGAFHGPQHVFIHMEFGGLCNLYRALRLAGGGFEPELVRQLLSQLLSAVRHCHACDVAHRDLKPENITLGECGAQLKVVDFGSAAPASKLRSDVVGSMLFMAPEVLAAGPERPYAPAGCDVWSSGALLLEMLCGLNKLQRMLGWGGSEKPCRARGEEVAGFFRGRGALMEAVQADLGVVDADLGALLQGMLAPAPASRHTAAQAAKSEWLRACG